MDARHKDHEKDFGMYRSKSGASQHSFYKSMITGRHPSVWQDVNCAVWKDEDLYMKFQHDPTRGYFVILLMEELGWRQKMME